MAHNRRWLQSAIDESRTTEVSLPWQRTAHSVDATAISQLHPTQAPAKR
ncbi:hypothetical protein [Mesobaculum littorinae]|nr:hypothetical protein [Mesobaculum littorinae]